MPHVGQGHCPCWRTVDFATALLRIAQESSRFFGMAGEFDGTAFADGSAHLLLSLLSRKGIRS
jgi:hypothetical protein